MIDTSGTFAYVSLRTQAEVAQVDLSTRTVTNRFNVMPDPRALALSSDGSTLYVAGHRTGAPERYPFGTDPVEEEQDIMVVDTNNGTVDTLVGNVGSVLTGLLLDEANNWLYVAQTASYPERGLVTLDAPPFESQVLIVDLNDRSILRQTTLDLLPKAGIRLESRALPK